MILSLAYHASAGQALVPKQAITLEIGGKGLLYNISYEHNAGNNIIMSAGFSFVHLSEKQTNNASTVLSFPLSVSYLYNFTNTQHYSEIGIGTTNLLTTGDLTEYGGITDLFINPTLIVGYRFYPTGKKWSLKASFTPFYGTKSLSNNEGTAFKPFGKQLQPWGGFGFSYEL